MVSGIKKYPDLLVLLLWIMATFVFVVIPEFQNNIARTILGIGMVLFIPGYIMVAVLFPKKSDLEMVDRLSLSFGLSVVTIILLGVVVNFTVGIESVPIIFILYIYSAIMIVIAIYRSINREGSMISIGFKKPRNKTDIILTIILVSVIIISIGEAYNVFSSPKTGEKFTEFYVLDASGKMDKYPTNLSAPVNVIVGVTNHEYITTNYKVQAVIGGRVLKTEELTLNNDENWNKNLTLSIDTKVTDNKLRFLLFKDNKFENPYRSLYLIMDRSVV